jgi:hypothetical protein
VTLFSQVSPALYTAKGKNALSYLASLTSYVSQVNRATVMPNLSERQDGGVEMILEDEGSLAEDNEAPDGEILKKA